MLRCEWEGCEAEAQIDFIAESRHDKTEHRNVCRDHESAFFETGGWKVRRRNWYPRMAGCCAADSCQHMHLSHGPNGCSYGCDCGTRGVLLPGTGTAEEMYEALQALSK